MGLDMALLAISAIALWQLRLYGAPLTKSVRGSLGLDPLLVAAPAIGLLAGGVLALRILPFLAQAAELALARGETWSSRWAHSRWPAVRCATPDRPCC